MAYVVLPPSLDSELLIGEFIYMRECEPAPLHPLGVISWMVFSHSGVYHIESRESEENFKRANIAVQR